ncbi:trans-sulfuration enzyme family protein [Anseongella ginsenosidimutans]|nr:PLP-dependent aspartate aminotransferase family protein [Anseongella ginsenosidimutans]QEC50930.1 PLP-dependent transferase [Anseongella ginsenosidimutans]
MDLSYILNHLGEDREGYFNAVAPPVVQTSNFAFPTVEAMRRGLREEFSYPAYTRGVNPTVEMLREKMAALEGAEDALVFASGSGAIASAVMSNVNSGDHIVSVRDPYTWTNILFSKLLPGFGVETTFIDGCDPANFEKAIKANTRILYLESPNSFTFELQDLGAVSEIARRRGVLTMIDNSYSGPLYQQPLKMGIALSIHSATKYIGGHSDTMGGVVCGSREMMRRIFDSGYMTLGGVAAPFNAWLLLRGLRTLALRMERSSDSTAKIIGFLEKQPEVEKIYYPLYKGNPQYELARRQMTKAGGLFTVALRAASVEQVERFCDSLKRFLLAVSWGGHESLVMPRCLGMPPGSTQEGYNLVRFYIGLEDPEVLTEDLRQALNTLRY